MTEPLGSIVCANGMILPIVEIELTNGTFLLSTRCRAGRIVHSYPYHLDINGEYRIHGPDGSLIMMGFAQNIAPWTLHSPLDACEFTATLNVSKDKRSSEWIKQHASR